MALFSRKSNVHSHLTSAAFSHLSVTSSEGDAFPRILNTYEAGGYGVAVWSKEGQSGFSVLHSVVGVWVVIGSDIGLCDAATLSNSYDIPTPPAADLIQQISGIPASPTTDSYTPRKGLFRRPV